MRGQDENEDDDAPFEDAQEEEVNEFEQYFVHDGAVDESDEDDFFYDDEDDDEDADAFEIDQEDEIEDVPNEEDDDEWVDGAEEDDGDDSDDDYMFGGVPRLVNNEEYDEVRQVQVRFKA